MANVKLPKGVTVYSGGHKYEGECPEELLPTKPTVSPAPAPDIKRK